MPADQATIREFLVEQLSALKAQLIDFAFKHGTVVCLLPGWILSSEQAQRFYAASLWIPGSDIRWTRRLCYPLRLLGSSDLQALRAHL